MDSMECYAPTSKANKKPELELNIMKNITIKEAAKIDAKGNLTSRKCKPVICIDTGEVYTSATDAAQANGTTVFGISQTCLGKTKTAKGKRFCYVQDFPEHLADITARISSMNKGYEEMEAKAKAYDAILAEQEAKAKAAEDERKAKEKAEADHAKAITKATEKLARCRALYERKENELDEAYQRMKAAERELEALNGNRKSSMHVYDIAPCSEGFAISIDGAFKTIKPDMLSAEQYIDEYMKG